MVTIPILLFCTGCKNKQGDFNNLNSKELLFELQEKVTKLESILEKGNNYPNQKTRASNNSLYIKSITFRLGTEDDRLRIYWTDGSKTNLPCTKEQRIWACG